MHFLKSFVGVTNMPDAPIFILKARQLVMGSTRFYSHYYLAVCNAWNMVKMINVY